MPTFLPVGSTSYIDNHGYDPFSRSRWLPSRPAQTRKVRRKPRPAPQKPKPREKSPEVDNKARSQDDLDLDYLGISNMMRSITFKGPRKWKLKNPDNDIDKKVNESKRIRPKKAWSDAESSPAGDNREDKEKEEVGVDHAALRRTRSSSFIKYKYPKEYHHGPQSQQSLLEENVPQCMRHYPRYTNLPMKQSCGYDPYRSVTQLKVHSVQSGSLPHPALPNAKARRPMSAPPSYGTKARVQRGAFHSKKQSKIGGAVADRHHNGVYHMVHEDFKPPHSPVSQIEYSTIEEEGGYDTQSLPLAIQAETSGPVIMKGDYSDEEEDDDFSPAFEDTVVSLEDVEEVDDEDLAANKTSIEQRYHSPLIEAVHTLSDMDSSDLEVKYEVKSDSGEDSLVDETLKAKVRSAPKKEESDAEEVESDY